MCGCEWVWLGFVICGLVELKVLRLMECMYVGGWRGWNVCMLVRVEISFMCGEVLFC